MNKYGFCTIDSPVGESAGICFGGGNIIIGPTAAYADEDDNLISIVSFSQTPYPNEVGATKDITSIEWEDAELGFQMTFDNVKSIDVLIKALNLAKQYLEE